MNKHLSRFPALLLLLLSCLAIALFGCQAPPGEEFALPEEPAPPPQPGDGFIGTLFYPDEQWRFLVPLQREIAETETLIRRSLEELAGTPRVRKELAGLGLAPLLPEGTAVEGINIGEGGLARIDFNRSFLEYDPAAERLVLGGLFCTLCQFPEIERLEIAIEGKVPEKFPGDTPGCLPLGPECLVNLEVDDALEDYHNYTAVTVYFCFPTPQGRILYVPVTRALPPAEDSALAALEELLKGPRSGSGLFSEIPPATELISLKLDEDPAIVDLSGEMLNFEGGRTGAENMVHQVLLTLARLEGVAGVQILVEGEKVKLPGGIDLTEPLELPALYNFF